MNFRGGDGRIFVPEPAAVFIQPRKWAYGDKKDLARGQRITLFHTMDIAEDV
jgi:hypothetical protein